MECLHRGRREVRGDGPRIDSAVEEHGEMTQLLSELLHARWDARRREATVRQLEAVAAHHMAEEERDVFPRLRKVDAGRSASPARAGPLRLRRAPGSAAPAGGARTRPVTPRGVFIARRAAAG